MNPTRTILLEFIQNSVGNDKKLTDGLSAVVQIGNTLWVVNDEALSVERLSLAEVGNTGDCHAANQKRFELKDFIDLPAGENGGEADLEGLALADGYLWLVGSHSLKRRNPKAKDTDHEIVEKLATLEGEGNRYLLARIPVEENGGVPELVKKSGDRRAAQLRGEKFDGDARAAWGDELIEALREDEHLGPFLPIPPKDKDGKKWRSIPGKDNGFDIEGLAAVGQRLFLGLRGPVLRGWAVVLEVEPEEADDGRLKLKPLGPKGRLYRKHFLQLGGLGVRDLCVEGSDLLVLAGPTMDLDGPVTVFRWPGGANPKGEAVVKAEQLKATLDLPFGIGDDHAEGISLFSSGDTENALIVVYDAPSERRRSGGTGTLLADVFPLP